MDIKKSDGLLFSTHNTKHKDAFLCPGVSVQGFSVQGVSVQGETLQTETPPRPWTEWLTHACENITLPQTLFTGGNNGYFAWRNVLNCLSIKILLLHQMFFSSQSVNNIW